jgi:hypothetical protein
MTNSGVRNRRRAALMCAGAFVLVTAAGSAQTGNSPAAVDPPRAPAIRLDLANSAHALGDHLRKPGKERTFLSGVVSFGGMSSVPVSVVRELSGKVRLELLAIGQPDILLFDGATGSQNGGVLNKQNEDLLELLAYDWPDQFLVNHGNGSGLRLLASRAQALEEGRPTGVFYDVYEALDQVPFGTSARSRVARFCLNSDTGLVERVHYRTASGMIEVRFSDWRQAEGQRFPARVERIENGNTTATVVFSSATFAAAANDGLLSGQ